ncbi:RNA-directed DNA polymerase, eukaryota, reverse transcriptase zinc-binding domain protein [Tanacetum coccineum]
MLVDTPIRTRAENDPITETLDSGVNFSVKTLTSDRPIPVITSPHLDATPPTTPLHANTVKIGIGCPSPVFGMKLRVVPAPLKISTRVFICLILIKGARSRPVALSDHKDSWLWSLNSSNEYTVASVRALVDANTLVVDTTATRWNRNVPIKVNVFLWRLALNKLPSKVNLDRIGIDVDSTLCSICGEDVETVNHIFFSCEMAKDLWALLAKWWSLDIPICSNFLEWSSWLDSLHLSSKKKLFLDGVGGTLLWSIWNFRNRLLFTVPPPKKAVLWDNIVSQSFLWISSRNPKLNFSWVGWIQHPLVSIASM